VIYKVGKQFTALKYVALSCRCAVWSADWSTHISNQRADWH